MSEILSRIASAISGSEFYMSLPFWLAFVVVVILYRVTPAKPILKETCLLACNILMLLMLPRFTVAMLGVFFALCIFTYAIGYHLNGRDVQKDRMGKVIAALGIIVVVFVLAFFKYRFVQAAILGPKLNGITGGDFLFLIGISYSSFKAMHVIIDGYKKILRPSKFVTFLNYMLFFPSFMSGPINRVNQYTENSAAKPAPLCADLAPGLIRIISGLFKKTVLTVAIYPYTLKAMGIPSSDVSFWYVLIGVYAFAFYLYWDFSGYTDMALGAARIMGFVLPENFKQPFARENIQKLWANYHISLTTWLTEYIYWPMVRRLRENSFCSKHPIFLSNFAIITTFALCGVWHGNTWVFLFWGIYHGAGLAILNIYQKWKRGVRNDSLRKYFRSRISQAAGVAATFNFYAAGTMLFMDPEQLGRIFSGKQLIVSILSGAWFEPMTFLCASFFK